MSLAVFSRGTSGGIGDGRLRSFQNLKQRPDNVKYFTHGSRHTAIVTKTPKWVFGCEARLKGLVDNRSVQDTPRRG
jgi:hypothetical protein